jgi:methenyltetrahydromethanopterin cyclohydrolase
VTERSTLNDASRAATFARRLDLNERSWLIADRAVANAAALRIAAHVLSCGARVIDAGIAVEGGLAAGSILAEMCMGGLGSLSFVPLVIEDRSWPGLQVMTDYPVESCMASQYAGWQIRVGDFFGMGSGPVRAHVRAEQELFERLQYGEEAHRVVMILETRTLPDDEVAKWIAERCRLEASRLTLVVAPTASLAGGVQIVARVVETALHKMDALHFDLTQVVSAAGTAPLAPVAKDDLRAIGRTNDCILYGSRAYLTVRAEDASLAELAERLPASASQDYGTPFYEIFKRYDGDFYRIDPLLFSPAEVWLTSTITGRTFHGGRLDADVLHASLYGS